MKNEQKIRLQNLLKLDGNAFLKSEIETIVGCFESFDKFKISNNFGDKVNFSLPNNAKISYVLPKAENAYICECEIGFNLI